MAGNYERILRGARLGDIPRLGRRVLGMRYLTENDFLPNVSNPEQVRIAGLAERARGVGPAPILVLGVMPRSGTNFLRDLLAMHPDVHADPQGVHEFPLLHAARGAKALRDEYISYFPENAEITGSWDALAMLSGAWMREFQITAGDQHILLKCPHVQNLSLAPFVFPDARIILCLRDGRDVLDSTQKSFSRRSLTRKTFAQLAWEWRLATEAVLAFSPGGKLEHPNVMVMRYEDVVAEPEVNCRRLLDHAGLDPAHYDFDALAALPVRGSSRSTAPEGERWKPEQKSEDFQPVRRWESWSAQNKARFGRIAGDMLEAASYAR
ncbi:MAG: sulfotransferase [Litoreibacter sp.]|nr:sulfotransferase [Litoreibacter sp.]